MAAARCPLGMCSARSWLRTASGSAGFVFDGHGAPCPSKTKPADPDAVRNQLLAEHIPKGQRAAAICAARNRDVKTMLKALYVAQEAYRGENDTYHTDLDTLGFRPVGDDYYTFKVIEATSTRFRAQAPGPGIGLTSLR